MCRILLNTKVEAVATSHRQGWDPSHHRLISCLGYKDFFGDQFVNYKPFQSYHSVRMNFVFFILQQPFYEATPAKFEVTWSVDSCWCGRVVLLLSILMKSHWRQIRRTGNAGPCLKNATALWSIICKVWLHREVTSKSKFKHVLKLSACLSGESPYPYLSTPFAHHWAPSSGDP